MDDIQDPVLDPVLDCLVIGGGPAGLQAALTLGRLHRSVLLLDSGAYRNDPADAMHNMLGHDGTDPADLRAAARADLAAYSSVAVRDVAVRTVTAVDDGFRADLADGTAATGRRLVLATGLRDTLPDLPGLAPLFGNVAAHCPYCHGHEYAGTHVAILGSGPHVARVALLLERIAARITVLADGGELDPPTAALLDDAGVAVRPEPVTGVCRSAAGATVTLAGGPPEEVGGLFVAPTLSQAAPFADQLGLDLLPSGCVRVDLLGRTSRPGVYAAGDLAHVPELPMPMAAVLTAAAAGLVAATAVDGDRLAERVGLAPPA
ncbi:NAD(P)/FAD-dependent oxidoreductase [Nocardioides pantholopis]|uniref:NAD(P)/FAD-dependent oxidoreductase n=1 Tax=Nocardioides pantholopis TaxID=2483798 RepID=UPI0019D149DB|nr:NAD(P)/FAD-dependent oxidoreductase [Nocardioides pantholopis]